MPLPIPVIIKSKPKIKNIDIAIISADAYCAASYSRRDQVFVVFMRDIQYKGEKKARDKTNQISVVFQKYYDFLYIFWKKDLNTLLSCRKYDHKI